MMRQTAKGRWLLLGFVVIVGCLGLSGCGTLVEHLNLEFVENIL